MTIHSYTRPSQRTENLNYATEREQGEYEGDAALPNRCALDTSLGTRALEKDGGQSPRCMLSSLCCITVPNSLHTPRHRRRYCSLRLCIDRKRKMSKTAWQKCVPLLSSASDVMARTHALRTTAAALFDCIRRIRWACQRAFRGTTGACSTAGPGRQGTETTRQGQTQGG